MIVSDVPLPTVTVLPGFTDQNAHSFSYWLPTGPHAGAAQVIGAFLGANFPAQQELQRAVGGLLWRSGMEGSATRG